MMKKIMAFSALVLSAQVSFADDAYDRYEVYESNAPMTNSFVFNEESKTEIAELKRRASQEDLVTSISSIDRHSNDDGYSSDEDEDSREKVYSSQKQKAEKIQDNFTKSRSSLGGKAWGFAKKAVSTVYRLICSFF